MSEWMSRVEDGAVVLWCCLTHNPFYTSWGAHFVRWALPTGFTIFYLPPKFEAYVSRHSNFVLQCCNVTSAFFFVFFINFVCLSSTYSVTCMKGNLICSILRTQLYLLQHCSTIPHECCMIFLFQFHLSLKSRAINNVVECPHRLDGEFL